MQQLAAAVQRQPPPEAKLDVAKVAAVMRNLSDVAATDPAEARRLMAEVVESAVLRCMPEGPEAEVTLKNTTASIAGGRVLAKSGCGGAMMSFLSTGDTAMILPIRGEFTRNPSVAGSEAPSCLPDAPFTGCAVSRRPYILPSSTATG